jgi:hypothetical protein
MGYELHIVRTDDVQLEEAPRKNRACVEPLPIGKRAVRIALLL